MKEKGRLSRKRFYFNELFSFLTRSNLEEDTLWGCGFLGAICVGDVVGVEYLMNSVFSSPDHAAIPKRIRKISQPATGIIERRIHQPGRLTLSKIFQNQMKLNIMKAIRAGISRYGMNIPIRRKTGHQCMPAILL